MSSPIIYNVTLSYLNSYIDWSTSSGEMSNRITDDPLVSYNPFKSTRQFIKLEQSFLKQLNDNVELFKDQSRFSLQEKMKISAEAILDCMPDKISLQLTEERSIFYTIIKDDLKIYFQHFLFEEFDECDEAIISIFIGNDNVLNYAGEFSEVINEYSRFMMTSKILKSDS